MSVGLDLFKWDDFFASLELTFCAGICVGPFPSQLLTSCSVTMMSGNRTAVGPDPSMLSVTSRNRIYYLIHIQPAVSPSFPPLYIEMRQSGPLYLQRRGRDECVGLLVSLVHVRRLHDSQASWLSISAAVEGVTLGGSFEIVPHSTRGGAYLSAPCCCAC